MKKIRTSDIFIDKSNEQNQKSKAHESLIFANEERESVTALENGINMTEMSMEELPK